MAQLEAALGTRPIARFRGRSFFTVYDSEAAGEWEARGASVARHDAGRIGGVFYEVYPATMLDPMPETNDEGEVVDVREAFLLEHLRSRDGYDCEHLRPRVRP